MLGHAEACAGVPAGAVQDEDDLLDKAWGLERESRLSCQAIMPEGDDLVVEIPRYSINHAKENH